MEKCRLNRKKMCTFRDLLIIFNTLFLFSSENWNWNTKTYLRKKTTWDVTGSTVIEGPALIQNLAFKMLSLQVILSVERICK